MPYTPMSETANRLAARENDLDEKPVVTSVVTGAVVGSIAGALVIVLFTVLVLLHLRRRRRDKAEWDKNPQELDDYGIDASQVKRPHKADSPGPNQQPFLAPRDESDQRTSRDDSLYSLARDLRAQENPFGPKAEIVSVKK